MSNGAFVRDKMTSCGGAIMKQTSDAAGSHFCLDCLRRVTTKPKVEVRPAPSVVYNIA